jgi:hypothetical protein
MTPGRDVRVCTDLVILRSELALLTQVVFFDNILDCFSCLERLCIAVM